MKLLEQLIAVHAPSGSEFSMKKFLLDYIQKEQDNWRSKPIIYAEEDQLQDNLILVFGEPNTAIFAHMDSVGYTCRYENQLVEIGSPSAKSGASLVGEDVFGPIDCKLIEDGEGNLFHDFPRAVQRGTTLTYKPHFSLEDGFVQSPYLDNRLGIYTALKVAETLEDGILVFSTYEEHGGGSMPLLLNFIQKHHPISQALIADITWVTDGVQHDLGVALSLRDHNIPRKRFVDKILQLADASGIAYQLEVESSGSSDGREVQLSPYAIDWMFIGAPEDNVHSPQEKVSISDIQSMIDMYIFLMKVL